MIPTIFSTTFLILEASLLAKIYQLTSASALRSGPSSALLIREEKATSLGSTIDDNCINVVAAQFASIMFLHSALRSA